MWQYNNEQEATQSRVREETMTGQELFEKFGGGYVLVKKRDAIRTEERHRLCGYTNDGNWCVLMENKGGANRQYFASGGVAMLDDLPDDWKGTWDSPDYYDWNDVLMITPDFDRICCRCGKEYSNKRTHRVECKI